jgi:DNA-binding NtrC family response regulator
MVPDHTTPAPVLVTEDEVLLNMVAGDVLTEAGYRVIGAYNADEALEVLHTRSDIKVLFTDVRMPGSYDGYALARIVDMRWPGIGIIVTTADQLPGPGDLPKGASFVAKPYTASTLLEVVRAALDPARRPITVHRILPQEKAIAPARPAALKIDQPHTRIGLDGGFAQPLQEPET